MPGPLLGLLFFPMVLPSLASQKASVVTYLNWPLPYLLALPVFRALITPLGALDLLALSLAPASPTGAEAP